LGHEGVTEKERGELISLGVGERKEHKPGW